MILYGKNSQCVSTEGRSFSILRAYWMSHLVLGVFLDAYGFLLPLFYLVSSCVDFMAKIMKELIKLDNKDNNCHLPPLVSVSAIRKTSLWNDVFFFSKEVLLTCRIYFSYLRDKGWRWSILLTKQYLLCPLYHSSLYKLIVSMMFSFVKNKKKEIFYCTHRIFPIN